MNYACACVPCARAASVLHHEWKALNDATRKWQLSFKFVTWMLHPESKYGRAAVRID